MLIQAGHDPEHITALETTLLTYFAQNQTCAQTACCVMFGAIAKLIRAQEAQMGTWN